MALEGVHTALVTPFTDSGAVDHTGLKRLLDRQLAADVDGVLPLGTTGEAPTLTTKEKSEILKTVISHVKGQIPVMVGVGSNCTATTIENAKMAEDAGADSLLVVTPYYNKPTQEGIFRHFEAVSKATNLPIIVYNIKGRSAVNIETATMQRLSNLPSIVAVKESSGDIQQISDVIEKIQSKNGNFAVLSGDDGLTLPAMALGARGVISVVSNLIPKEVVALVSAALAGDFELARKMHFQLSSIFKVLFIESNPAPVKCALNLCDVPVGGLRLPLCQLSRESEEILRNNLKEFGLLR